MESAGQDKDEEPTAGAGGLKEGREAASLEREPDVVEAYRTVCPHYSRGCSLVVCVTPFRHLNNVVCDDAVNTLSRSLRVGAFLKLCMIM